MIPVRVADVDSLLAEVDRQNAEVDSWVERLDDTARTWRPDPTRWSLAGHVEHLNIVNAAYLGVLESTIADARAGGGPESDGPYRHPFIARRFVRMMEPPPSMRMKTARAMTPDPAVDATTPFETFAKQQDQLVSLIAGSRGLDLGKILRLSLGTGFEVLLAHNRRHLWLIQEVLEHDDFPGSATGVE